MKTSFSLIFLLLYSTTINHLSGHYQLADQWINFQDNKVDFNIHANGGLVINLKGNGHYKLYHDYLLVKTEGYKGQESEIKKQVPNKDKFIDVKVLNSKGIELSAVHGVVKERNGEIIATFMTDEAGIIRIDERWSSKTLTLQLLAYEDFSFTLDAKYDYDLNLLEGEIIEYTNVLFRLKQYNKEKIGIKLLSSDYKGAEQLKAFQRKEKSIESYQFRERIMEK